MGLLFIFYLEEKDNMKNKNAFYALIKTRDDNYYATTLKEFNDIINRYADIQKTIIISDSLTRLIEDDYDHSDVCMSELIRSTYMDKVDFEDISTLLQYAGEQDRLGELTEELMADKEPEHAADSELFAYVEVNGEKYYATTNNELMKILEDNAGEKKSIVQFSSIIELIKNDYYGNATMVDTIKNRWMDKITHKDISNLLRFAGELDRIGELIEGNNEEDVIADTGELKRMIEECRYIVSYTIDMLVYLPSELHADISLVNAPKEHRDLMFQLASDISSNFAFCNVSGCITIPITDDNMGKLYKFLKAVKE